MDKITRLELKLKKAQGELDQLLKEIEKRGVIDETYAAVMKIQPSEIGLLRSENYDLLSEKKRQKDSQEATVNAFQEALKIFKSANGGGVRSTSLAGKAEAVLKKTGHSLSVRELVIALGPDVKSGAIATVLGSKVLKDIVFTRPHPGVFGLKTFAHENLK